MVFTRKPIKQASMPVTLKITDEPLENATTTTLLGIHIDEKLKWTEHISVTKRKPANGLFALN